MKHLLLYLFLFLNFTSHSFSSSLTEEINAIKIGPLECSHTLTLDSTGTDSYKEYIVYCFFQNSKYRHIVDLGSIYIPHDQLLVDTIASLKNCLKYMDKKVYAIDCGKRKNRFVIYDNSSDLWIYSRDESIPLDKDRVLDLIKWLETIPEDKIQKIDEWALHTPFKMRS